MKKIILIIVAVLIIAGLGIGFLGGVLYQQGKNKHQDLLSYLSSSKIIASVATTGEVTKISGRTITLSNREENFSITIKEDEQVYLSTPGNQAVSSFEDIKVGDKLTVTAKVLPDGQLEILAVIIYRL